MHLSIGSHFVGDVTVLDLSGRFSTLEGSILKNTVRSLIERGTRRIVFNLAGLKYIDSFGLGQLISAYTTIRSEGGDVKFLKPDRPMRDLLRITKLDTVFEIISDESVINVMAKCA